MICYICQFGHTRPRKPHVSRAANRHIQATIAVAAARLVVALAIGAFPISAPTLGAQVMQTGDVAKRGLEESDFPRAKELIPGVYSYEACRAHRPLSHARRQPKATGVT